MTASELESYLHENIPLTNVMRLKIIRADQDEIRISAPLEPNVNHQGNAFGGSIAAVAMATGWCAMRLAVGPDAQIVIQKAEIDYLLPIQSLLEAHCQCPTEKEAQKLRDRVAKRGRARTTFDVRLESEGKLCARLVGKYVALKLAT